MIDFLSAMRYACFKERMMNLGEILDKRSSRTPKGKLETLRQKNRIQTHPGKQKCTDEVRL